MGHNVTFYIQCLSGTYSYSVAEAVFWHKGSLRLIRFFSIPRVWMMTFNLYIIYIFFGVGGCSRLWLDYLINSFVPKKAWCISTSVTSLSTAPILVKFSLQTVKLMMLLTGIQSATYPKDIILKKLCCEKLQRYLCFIFFYIYIDLLHPYCYICNIGLVQIK